MGQMDHDHDHVIMTMTKIAKFNIFGLLACLHVELWGGDLEGWAFPSKQFLSTSSEQLSKPSLQKL